MRTKLVSIKGKYKASKLAIVQTVEVALSCSQVISKLPCVVLSIGAIKYKGVFLLMQQK